MADTWKGKDHDHSNLLLVIPVSCEIFLLSLMSWVCDRTPVPANSDVIERIVLLKTDVDDVILASNDVLQMFTRGDNPMISKKSIKSLARQPAQDFPRCLQSYFTDNNVCRNYSKENFPGVLRVLSLDLTNMAKLYNHMINLETKCRDHYSFNNTCYIPVPTDSSPSVETIKNRINKTIVHVSTPMNGYAGSSDVSDTFFISAEMEAAEKQCPDDHSLCQKLNYRIINGTVQYMSQVSDFLSFILKNYEIYCNIQTKLLK